MPENSQSTEGTQDTTGSTELVEYQTHITESLDNLVNISLFNGFFLGAILGAIFVTVIFKRVRS